MSVLIPILSKQENDTEFLSKAIHEQTYVYLLLIVEARSLDSTFGFTASQINHGNALINEIKTILEKQNKKVYDTLEWGDTTPRIINFAKLKKITKIALKNQENEDFKKLVKQLKQENLNVQVI